jgi:hypothetical protein
VGQVESVYTLLASTALNVGLGITRHALGQLHAHHALQIPISLETDHLPVCNVTLEPPHMTKLEFLLRSNVLVIQQLTTLVKAAWIVLLGSLVLGMPHLCLLPLNMANQNGLQKMCQKN